MGTALLTGLLNSKSEEPKPRKFIACVRRQDAAQRLRDDFSAHKEVEVVCNDSARALHEADIVLLGFRPGQVSSILEEPEIAQALSGKHIISLLAGVSSEKISDTLAKGAGKQGDSAARIVRVIPSIGAQIGASCSLVSDTHVSDSDLTTTKSMFSHVGSTTIVPEELLDTAVAISSTSHALTVTAVDALTDGSVSRGIPRSEALKLAAACLRSASTLLLEKMTLVELKDSMSVPKGITTEAWIHLDNNGVRAGISQATRNAVDYAKRMG